MSFISYNVDPATLMTVPVVSQRAAAIGTAYQPSATRPSLVICPVSISSGVAGDGSIQFLSDAANPPTTVRSTYRVGTALSVMSGQISGIVPAGHYYKLLGVTAGGTPAFSIVGNVQEYVM